MVNNQFKYGFNKQQGFSLLELLLVLALITTLSLAGIAAYQIQLRNFKIDKTALQMQQWLQAGMAFYIDCHQWPDPTKDADIVKEITGVPSYPISVQACPTLVLPMEKAYMPLGSDSNGPWPNSYTFGVGSPSSLNAPPAPDLFYVQTEIGPDTPMLETIAKSIAARLPNAQFYVDNSQQVPQVAVVAYTNLPGTVNDNTHGYILDMEIVQSNKPSIHITQPTAADCPPNFQPVLVGAVTQFKGSDYSVIGSFPIKQGQFTNNSNNAIDPKTGFLIGLQASGSNFLEPSYKISSTIGSNSSSGNNVLLISACLPKPTTGKQSAATQTTNAVQRY